MSHNRFPRPRYHSFPVSSILPQAALSDDVTSGGERAVALAFEVLPVVRLDAHLRVLPELEVKLRAAVGSARQIEVTAGVELRKLAVSTLELILAIVEMELEDIVRRSVRLEPFRRALWAYKAVLAAEDQQRPVDELQQELLLVPDAVSGRRKLAVRFDRDVLVAGGLETNVRAVPLEAEERRVDPSDRRSLDVAVRDPVLFGVGEHAHFAGLFWVEFHLENFLIADFKTLVRRHFIAYK